MRNRRKAAPMVDKGPKFESRCKACTHPERDQIDEQIRGMRRSGRSFGAIGAVYGLSESSTKRHGRNHVAMRPRKVELRLDPASPEPTEEPIDPTALRPIGRACATCRLPPEQRAEAEKLMASGVSLWEIERRLGSVTDDSLAYHLDHCVPHAVLRARLTFFEGGSTAANIMERAQQLVQNAEELIHDAKTGTASERAKALQAARGCLDLLARICGVLGPEVQVQIIESPTFRLVVRGVREAVCPVCKPRVEQAIRLLAEAPNAGTAA